MYFQSHNEWCTHCDRFSLEATEHVTTMKVMLLRSQETMSGRKEYIVMGTTYICSEDSISTGKVYIFGILRTTNFSTPTFHVYLMLCIRWVLDAFEDMYTIFFCGMGNVHICT